MSTACLNSIMIPEPSDAVHVYVFSHSKTKFIEYLSIKIHASHRFASHWMWEFFKETL